MSSITPDILIRKSDQQFRLVSNREIIPNRITPLRMSHGLNNPRRLLSEKRRELSSIIRDSLHRSRNSLMDEMRKSTNTSFRKQPIVRKTISRKLVSLSGTSDEEQRHVLLDGGLPFKYKVHARAQKHDTGWNPSTREAATFTTVGNQVYLIGGVTSEENPRISYLQRGSYRWTRLDQQRGWQPKFGHSTLASYDNTKLYIFGGVRMNNREYGAKRQLNNYIDIFDIKTMEWTEVEPKGNRIASRRYHMAVMVGQHMLVYGGINTQSQYLGDVYAFNIHTQQWTHVTDSTPVACHSGCAVYPSEFLGNCRFSLHYSPKPKHVTSSKNKIVDPGVYIFGGMDSESKPKGDLRILKTGKADMVWKTPSCTGKPPVARFLASMTYVRAVNLIAIFGGRGNHLDQFSHWFNDLHLLNMDSLLWARVLLFGQRPSARASHWAAAMDSQLLIFGGCNAKSYCDGDLWIYELAAEYAEPYIREDKNAAKELKIREELAMKRNQAYVSSIEPPTKLDYKSVRRVGIKEPQNV